MTPFLPRTCSTSELCGRFAFRSLRLLTIPVEGVGFEPTKPFRAPDLQSGGISRSPTPPCGPVFIRLGQKLPCSRCLLTSVSVYSPRGDSNPLTYRLQIGCAALAPLGHFALAQERNFPWGKPRLMIAQPASLRYSLSRDEGTISAVCAKVNTRGLDLRRGLAMRRAGSRQSLFPLDGGRLRWG